MRPRRGIALLLVLVLISVGSVLAMSFVQMASSRCVLAQSCADSRKAEFLAESGISEACYWMRHPELTGGSLWAGVQGRRPDADATDYYNVTVRRLQVNPPIYRAASEAHLMDAAGQRLVRTVSADFQLYYGFAEAVLAPDRLFVPSSVTILGNVFAYNRLDNHGTIDGSVYVGKELFNAGTITGMSVLNAYARTIGYYTVSPPILYWSKGLLYAAQAILSENITNQTWGAGVLNPAGAFCRSGNLRLYGSTTIRGTLMVTGDLTFCANSTTTITPQPGWPALVVKDDLVLENDGINVTVNGAVIVMDRMKTWGSMPNSRVTINGALVFPNGGGGFDGGFSTQPKITITHDPSRVDVSGYYSSQPYSLAGGLMIGYRADGT